MKQIERIVCPVDFSPASEAAAEYALQLAQRLKARVAFLHSLYAQLAGVYSETLDLDELYRSVRREADAKLGALRARAEAAEVPAELAVVEGPVAPAVREFAQRWSADLVVMATHGRQGLRRWLLGSTAEGLLRSLPAPLLTMARPDKQHLNSRLEHVVVGVQFDPETDGPIMEYALMLASKHGARLTLVHALEGLNIAARQDYTDILKEGLEARLWRLVPAELRELGTVSVVVEEPLPAEALLRWGGREDVDLVVIGARRKGLVVRALMGATVEALVRQSPCPVVTVPVAAYPAKEA
ncbi:universal stress protein [Ectothiorhodospiraceae bacterium 2226]|nr:universal stress protein [Ectothiorhodospiraceae bacterium 2226]